LLGKILPCDEGKFRLACEGAQAASIPFNPSAGLMVMGSWHVLDAEVADNVFIWTYKFSKM
jgi:hypothetical protein